MSKEGILQLHYPNTWVTVAEIYFFIKFVEAFAKITALFIKKINCRNLESTLT
jgi:hypothetical protein